MCTHSPHMHMHMLGAHVCPEQGERQCPFPSWGDRCPAGTTAQWTEATGSPRAAGQPAREAGVSGQGLCCRTGQWLGAGHGWAITGHHVTGTLVTRGCRWHLVQGGEVARVPQPCCIAAPASPGQSPSCVPMGPVSQATCSTGYAEPQHSPGWAWGVRRDVYLEPEDPLPLSAHQSSSRG